MANLSTNFVAQWKGANEEQPLDFLYQKNGACLVTYPKSYLHLKPDEAITTHSLEGIENLAQLHPWKEQYLLLVLNKEDYTNIAYQVDSLYPISKHLLEGLEDPQRVVYSVAQDVLYYKHTSVRLYTYNPIQKKSSPVLPDLKIRTMEISDDGRYLAAENSRGIHLIETATNTISHSYPSISGTYYRLVGVTNTGQILVVRLGVARKGTDEAATPMVLLLDGNTKKELVTAASGWARWNQEHLMVMEAGTFKLYDASILK